MAQGRKRQTDVSTGGDGARPLNRTAGMLIAGIVLLGAVLLGLFLWGGQGDDAPPGDQGEDALPVETDAAGDGS